MFGYKQKSKSKDGNRKMVKNQTTFSPLECGLCKRTDCSYRKNYESLYQAGMQIKISHCKRLQDLKAQQQAKNKGVWI